MNKTIRDILTENDRRNAAARRRFNPITGEGSILERRRVEIEGFPLPVQWLPEPMLREPFVRELLAAGSLNAFFRQMADTDDDPTEADTEYIVKSFVRIRCRHDFPFWAALYVYIKAKGGGEDVLFRLNRPQRLLVSHFEEERIAGRPIRFVLLKARQWGGSTATQMYMAWLQLVHRRGLNSLIVGHVKDVAYEVQDMFGKMIARYPTEMLHPLGQAYDAGEPKWTGVGQSANMHRVPQRGCKVKIGSYEKPDSARGGDYNLVHCTEVGLWAPTEGKNPADVVRSACSGITLRPYTMIVYESTANGTGNFFEAEYLAAKKGDSQFKSIFVAWHQIDLYRLPVDDPERLAAELYAGRENAYVPSERAEPGRYLWYLWQQGATLENIAWYIEERKKYTDHGDMASEFPTDDNEAFTYSGFKVFDKILVERLRTACKPPRHIGDIYADANEGKEALHGVRFTDDHTGQLCIWAKPDISPTERITDRYVVVVDIGGRSAKADWSVILVIDRLPLMDGDRPEVVAQWYGHIDMDLLAWKSAQIATFYDNALLVIESNTLETKDRERIVDGDQSQFILSQIKNAYPNLYAREQSEEDIREGVPRKYGFHTNVATKPMIISHLVKVIREHLYTERDERCIDEYLTYEQKHNGSFGAIAGKHDDLLMTRAIGLWIAYNFKVMPLPRIVPRRPKTASASAARHVDRITEAVF